MRTASAPFLEERAQTQRPRLLPGSALLTLRGRGEGRAGRRGGVGAPLWPDLSDFRQDAGKEPGGPRPGIYRSSFVPLGPWQQRTVGVGTVGSAGRHWHAKDHAILGPAQAQCDRAGVVRQGPAGWVSPTLCVSPLKSQSFGAIFP